MSATSSSPHEELTIRDVALADGARLSSTEVGQLRGVDALAGPPDPLLNAVAEALRCLIVLEDFETAIQRAMRIVGEAANIHRFKVILSREARPGAAACHELAYEWFAPFLKSQASHQLTHFPDVVIAPYVGPAKRGQSQWQLIDDVEGPLRAPFEQVGMQSMGVVPIFAGSLYAGVAAFDDCLRRRAWTPREIDALTIAAQGIGVAIHQRELALKDAAAAAEQQRIARFLEETLGAASASLELEQSVEAVVAGLARELGAVHVHLFRFDPDSDQISLALSCIDGVIRRGMDGSELPLLAAPFRSDITPAWAIMTQSPGLYTPDLIPIPPEEFGWPGALEYGQRFGLSDMGHIVLFADRHPIASVGFSLNDGRRLTASDKRFVEGLAVHAARVIRLIDLAEASKQAALHRERSAIAEHKVLEAERSSTAMQATIDALQDISEVEQIVPRVLGIIAETFGAAACAAFDNEPDGTVRLKFWHVDGQTMTSTQLLASGRLDPATASIVPVLADGFTVPDSYLGAAAARAIGVFVVDHRQGTSVPAFDDFAIRNHWDLELNAGVGFQGVRRATLCIYRQAGKAFTEAEQALAHSLAKQMALAIGVARLAENGRQAALAIERQQAAEQLSAQLTKANEGLHESARRLVRGSSVNDILPVTLDAAMECAGAVAGSVLRRVGDTTEFVFVLISQDGRLLSGEPLQQHPFTAQVRAVSRRDPAGHFRRLATGETVWYLVSEHEVGPIDQLQRWHAPRGQLAIWDVPFVIGGRVAGYLGLAFAHTQPPTESVRQIVGALATQVGLALEMTDLAGAAQSAVVARERETFARERAMESERRAAMLAAIAQASRDLHDAEDFELGLVAWLRRVSCTAGADAAGLGEYRFRPGSAHPVPIIRAAWSSASPDARLPAEAQVPEVPDTADFTAWTGRILRGEVVWANYSDLEDPASRRYWDAEGCAGHVLVPVPLVGDAKGFLSFDFFTERPFDAELVTTIRNAADGLSSAMRRYAAYQAQLAERDAHSSQVNKANMALQATIDAVTDLQTLDAIMPRALAIFADAFDAKGVGYFEYPDDRIHHRFWLHEGQLLTASGLPDLDPEDLVVTHRLAAGFKVPVEHLGVDFRYRSRPSVVHHRSATASPDLHAFAMRRGWDWELNIPLFVSDRSDAAITLFRAEERPFTDVDCALAESLAKQIGLARQVSRIGEREREVTIARERAAELARANQVMRRVNDLVASERNPQAVISHVLRELTELVGAEAAALFHFEADHQQLRFAVGYESGHIVQELVGHPYGHRDRPSKVEEFPAWNTLISERKQLFSSVTLDLTVPPSNDWHVARGHRMLALSALFVGSAPIGLLALAFAAEVPLSPAQLESFSALAQQMTLAIQFVRLAEQAQTASLLEERNRIARDLHDTMAQSFTGIYMQLQAAERYSDSDQSLARACIDRAQTLAREGLHDARRSVLALASGSQFMDLAAIITSVADLASTGTPCPCVVRIEGDARSIDAYVGGNIVAICREAIGNAQRYSEATRLLLTIRYLPHEVEVRIIDNGRGFTLPESMQSGFGLAGMVARAQRVGGELRIESAPDQGTTIVLRVPLLSAERPGQVQR